MRHIPLKEQCPDQAWIDKANRLIEELKTAPDAEARKKIIDHNSKVWGELKTWLLSLSHGKCWFSEAKDCFSHWDVEHFRPKKSAKDLDGTEYDGYWWLAFDWQNLRICGNAGNRKKSTYFPLREGCARAACPDDDLRYEDPQLLDPIDEDDPNLLSFNVEGRAIPAPGLEAAWDKERVEYSVERFNLDFPPLVDKRKTIWNECWRRIQLYRDELGKLNRSNGTNVIARNQAKTCAKEIRSMMREEKELSAVARACVLSTGDPRLLGLLQSA
ncbi:MAG: hypothetical protein CSYNP_00501 [Syntrophus sp. SKADARSKE-3]|nr:hypothetical protein [Syntrophus sp. SKADARSKE-3]